MNLKVHAGNVTGDEHALVMTYCECSAYTPFEIIGCLDAPEWINEGRMVAFEDWQFQTFNLRTNAY